MSQVFNAETYGVTPVSVVQIYNATVLEHRQADRNGYLALVVGFDPVPLRKVNKPRAGYCKRFGDVVFRYVREMRVDTLDPYPVGTVLGFRCFAVGDGVEAVGISKGKGFQGVIKRCGKGGGPAAHGSGFHRTTGSIGQRTYPGKVFKNMGMAGRMGGDRVKVKGLSVVAVDEENETLLVKGAIPGSINGLVFLEALKQDFTAALRQSSQASQENEAVSTQTAATAQEVAS